MTDPTPAEALKAPGCSAHGWNNPDCRACASLADNHAVTAIVDRAVTGFRGDLQRIMKDRR